MHARTHILILAPLLIAVAGFGFGGANADSLWYDEFWSIFNAGGAHYEGQPRDEALNPLAVWRQVATVDPIHPPGYSLLLNAWARLAGWSVFAGRVLSALTGVLSIAMIYRAGRDLLSPRAGLIAAVLFGTSAFYAHYLHELRMYTLLAFLVCTALWSYWRLLERQGGAFSGAIFAISLAGLVYTQYLSAFVIIGIGIYHLFRIRMTRCWWATTGLALLAGVVFIPWLPHVLGLFETVSGGGDRPGVYSAERVLTFGAAIITNSFLTVPRDYLLTAFPVVIGLFTLSLWTARRTPQPIIYLWIVTVITGLLMGLISENTGFFIHIRYLIVMMPAILLLVSAGASLLRPSFQIAAVVVWVLSGWWNYSAYEDRYNRDDQWTLPWSDIQQAAATTTNADDLLVIQAAGQRAWWDYAQISEFYLADIPSAITINPLRTPTNAEAFQEQVTEQLNDATRVVYIADATQPGQQADDFVAALIDRYTQCDQSTLPDRQVVVTIYARTCTP